MPSVGWAQESPECPLLSSQGWVPIYPPHTERLYGAGPTPSWGTDEQVSPFRGPQSGGRQTSKWTWPPCQLGLPAPASNPFFLTSVPLILLCPPQPLRSKTKSPSDFLFTIISFLNISAGFPKGILYLLSGSQHFHAIMNPTETPLWGNMLKENYTQGGQSGWAFLRRGSLC